MNYDEILAKSDYAATSDQTLDTYAEESASAAKAKALEDARKQKMGRLGEKNQGANLDNSYSVLPSGTIESNRNKIWNDLDGANKQTALGDTVAEYGVYKEGDKYYQGTGSSRREYTGDLSALRRAYMYGTKDDPDAVKFGLARGDLPSSDYRYLPGQAEAEGYNVGKNGYGWDAGESGVDLNKKYMDVLLPYEQATALEAMIHGNTGALEDRKYKDYLGNEALQHASGVSEYYNSAEGMLGDTSGMTEEEYAKAAAVNEVEGFSQLPGVQNKYVNASKITEKDINRAVEQAMDDDGYLGNLVDGLQASGGGLIAKTGDTVADALVKASRTARQVFTGESNQELNEKFQKDIKGTFMEDWFGKDGDFQLFDKYKDQEEYGYDNTLIRGAEESVKKAWKSGDVGDILDAIVDTVKAAPDLIVTSSADILLAASGPVGLGLYASNFNNEILENRAEIKGGVDKLTGEDYLIAPLAAVPAAVLNKVTMGNAGIREFTEAAKKAITLGGPSVAKEISKAITKGFITEGLEEGAQTGLIEIGSKLATAKEDELGNDEFWEGIVVGSALGAGAGGVTAGVGSAYKEGKEGLSYLKEQYDDKMDVQAAGTETKQAMSAAGRRTRFESVKEGLEVEEEAKSAYAKDISRHLGDIWGSAKEREKSGYGTEFIKAMDDVTDTIAKMYNVKDENARKVIEAQVQQDVIEYFNSIDEGTGTTTLATEEEVEQFIKDTLAKEPDNVYMQNNATKYFDSKIEKELDKVREELGDEGVDAETVPLNKDTMNVVKRVIADMRKMGSEDLGSHADQIEKGLEVYKKSQENPKAEKSVEDVANEALITGFFGREYRKGLQQHMVDLEKDVLSGANRDGEAREKSLDEFFGFVKSRVGKLKPFYKVDNKYFVRDVDQIRKFIAYDEIENKRILELADKVINSGKLSGEELDTYTELRNNLRKEIGVLSSLDQLGQEGQRKAFYSEMIAYLKEVAPKEVSDEILANKGVAEVLAKQTNKESVELKDKTKKWIADKLAAGINPETIKAAIDNTNMSDRLKGLAKLFVEARIAQNNIEEVEAETEFEVEAEVVQVSEAKTETKQEAEKPNEKIVDTEVGMLEDLLSEYPTVKEKKEYNKSFVVNGIEVTKDMFNKLKKGKYVGENADELIRFIESDVKLAEMTFEEVRDSSINEKENIIPEYSKAELKSVKAFANVVKKVIEGKKLTAGQAKLFSNESRLEEYRRVLQGLSQEEYTTEYDRYMEKNPTLAFEGEIEVKTVTKSIEEETEVLEEEVADIDDTPLSKLDRKTKVLKDSIERLEADIDTLETDKAALKAKQRTVVGLFKQAKKELDSVEKYKSDVEANKKGYILSRVKKALSKVIENIKLLVNALKKYQKAYSVNKEKIDAINAEIREKRKGVSRRKKAIKAMKQSVTGIPNISRRMEDSKGTIGLAGKLFGLKGKSVEEKIKGIMSIMPAIVKDSEEGESRVKEALETMSTFNEARSKNAAVPSQKVDLSNFKDKESEAYKKAKLVNEETNPLIRYGFDEVLSDPKNEEMVREALNVVSMIMFSKMESVMHQNNQQLTDTVNGAFGSMFPGGKVPGEFEDKIKNMLKAGKVVPTSMYMDTAGPMLLKQLEKKLSNTLTGEERAAIEAGLSVVVFSYMQNTVGGLDKKTNGIQRASLVRNGNSLEVSVGNTSSGMSSVNLITIEKMNPELLKKYRKTGATLEFAASKDVPPVSLKPLTGTNKVRNANAEMSEKAKDYQNRESSSPWKFSEDMKAIAAEYNEFKRAEDVEKFKRDVLGDLDSRVGSTSTMEMDSMLAKYTADSLQVDRLVEVYKLVGDKEFYIPWDYTRSGRNMMDSIMINPQNSKISRFLVGAKDMQVEVDTTSKNSRNFIYAGAAQALDLDLDKKLDIEVFEKLEQEYFKLDEDGKLEITGTDSFRKAVEEPTLENVNAWAKEAHGGIAIGEKMHVLQLVQLLNKLSKGETRSVTQLALEVDGITNGMSSILIQIGFNNTTIPLLTKTGYYVKAKDGDYVYRSHGEFKSGKNKDTGEVIDVDGKDGEEGLDIYMTPSEPIKNAFDRADDGLDRTRLIDSIIGGKWRNFMKGPVMVFIYGSGMKNIRTAVARSLIVGNSYIGGAAKTGKWDEVLELAGVITADMNEKQKTAAKRKYVEYKKYNPEKGIMEGIPNPNGLSEKDRLKYTFISEENVSDLTYKIDKNIGEYFSKGFNDKFKPVVEFRKALKLVDQVNYLIFKARVIKEAAKIGKTAISSMTPDQIMGIYKKLMKEGTYYGADNATGGIQDYVKLEGSEAESTWTMRVPPQANNNGKFNSYTDVAGRVKELVANVGATGVVTVHDIDGSVMIEGHKAAVLNIYDALMLGMSAEKNVEQIQDMNKAFHDINTRHSILGKAVKKLVRNVENAKVDVDFSILEVGDEYNNIISDLQRVLGNGESSLEIMEYLESGDIVKTLESVHNSRMEMKNYDVLSNQYYGVDFVEGYESTDFEVEGVFNPERVEEEMDVVDNVFKRVADATRLGRKVEAERKKKTAIMRQLDQIIAGISNEELAAYADKIVRKGC